MDTLGGGFSLYARKYGTGAANLLQAKIVIADGHVLVINAYQYPRLFWAIRGGGPGFGVVTQMTYRTNPLPTYFNFVKGTITAKNTAAYKVLLKYFLRSLVGNEASSW